MITTLPFWLLHADAARRFVVDRTGCCTARDPDGLECRNQARHLGDLRRLRLLN
ncbi:hypothetical protein [Cryobacterium psychrophilum]|uniref:hypothetical protein n=1 Tax=Cryobacterium psychrophilum TaxID=41988 RepID=UPI001416FF56|nr:hypothetical protein [Cryobacterium psychrophilum]